MFQYSFVLKSITCIIYLIEKETSSEKIEKLYELSLILKSHACLIVTQNVIERFSVTIDCVRFLISGFPLYTYSMAESQKLFWSFLKKCDNIAKNGRLVSINIKSISRRWNMYKVKNQFEGRKSLFIIKFYLSCLSYY